MISLVVVLPAKARASTAERLIRWTRRTIERNEHGEVFHDPATYVSNKDTSTTGHLDRSGRDDAGLPAGCSTRRSAAKALRVKKGAFRGGLHRRGVMVQVAPPTLERSFASPAEVPHAYGPSGVRFSVCHGWSGSPRILIFAMDNL